MMILPTTHLLALSLFAPATTPPPTEVAALHARFDPSLDSFRAGSAVAPASFGAHERAELTAAQERSPSLDALRAGDEPSNNEWKWIAIGAVIVLLIVLI